MRGALWKGQSVRSDVPIVCSGGKVEQLCYPSGSCFLGAEPGTWASRLSRTLPVGTVTLMLPSADVAWAEERCPENVLSGSPSALCPRRCVNGPLPSLRISACITVVVIRIVLLLVIIVAAATGRAVTLC